MSEIPELIYWCAVGITASAVLLWKVYHWYAVKSQNPQALKNVEKYDEVID